MHRIPMVGGPFDGKIRECSQVTPKLLMHWMKPEPVTSDVGPSREVVEHTYTLRTRCDGTMYYEHESIVGEG